MIVLSLVTYYLLAFLLIGAAVLLALRQNKRDADVVYAQWEQERSKWRDTTPPLPRYVPAPIDDELEDEPDAEETPDLSAAVLQPITPLLMRVAQEYLDKPHERERLVHSLAQALGLTATSSPAP